MSRNSLRYINLHVATLLSCIQVPINKIDLTNIILKFNKLNLLRYRGMNTYCKRV